VSLLLHVLFEQCGNILLNRFLACLILLSLVISWSDTELTCAWRHWDKPFCQLIATRARMLLVFCKDSLIMLARFYEYHLPPICLIPYSPRVCGSPVHAQQRNTLLKACILKGQPQTAGNGGPYFSVLGVAGVAGASITSTSRNPSTRAECRSVECLPPWINSVSADEPDWPLRTIKLLWGIINHSTLLHMWNPSDLIMPKEISGVAWLRQEYKS